MSLSQILSLNLSYMEFLRAEFFDLNFCIQKSETYHLGYSPAKFGLLDHYVEELMLILEL